MILRAGQAIRLAGRLDGQRRRRIHGRRRPQADTHRRRPARHRRRVCRRLCRRPRSAVAQRHGHRARGLARQHIDRDLALAGRRNFSYHHLLVFDAQLLRRGRANQGRVVPGQPGHRIGQFLEPTVVGKTAVVDRRVAAEDDFQLVRRQTGILESGRFGESETAASCTRRPDPLRPASGCRPAAHRAMTCRHDVARVADDLLRERSAHQCLGVGISPLSPLENHRQHFDRRAAVRKRRDHRLDDAVRSVDTHGRRPRIRGNGPEAGAMCNAARSRRGIRSDGSLVSTFFNVSPKARSAGAL